jgi:hypothetical protein
MRGFEEVVEEDDEFAHDDGKREFLGAEHEGQAL